MSGGAMIRAGGMIVQNFSGLFAPAGTPGAIIAQISGATHAAMADPELRRKLFASGFEPYPDSSAEAARRCVDEEAVHWAANYDKC